MGIELTGGGILFGGSLRDTVFNNFADPTSLFVRLLDGALFEPGQPTIIDATNVDFDTFLPPHGANVPLIEAQILDFDDLNTLGQNFAGLVPPSAGEGGAGAPGLDLDPITQALQQLFGTLDDGFSVPALVAPGDGAFDLVRAASRSKTTC